MQVRRLAASDEQRIDIVLDVTGEQDPMAGHLAEENDRDVVDACLVHATDPIAAYTSASNPGSDRPGQPRARWPGVLRIRLVQVGFTSGTCSVVREPRWHGHIREVKAELDVDLTGRFRMQQSPYINDFGA
jgi:hypothetical protein